MPSDRQTYYVLKAVGGPPCPSSFLIRSCDITTICRAIHRCAG